MEEILGFVPEIGKVVDVKRSLIVWLALGGVLPELEEHPAIGTCFFSCRHRVHEMVPKAVDHEITLGEGLQLSAVLRHFGEQASELLARLTGGPFVDVLQTSGRKHRERDDHRIELGGDHHDGTDMLDECGVCDVMGEHAVLMTAVETAYVLATCWAQERFS